MQRAIIQRIDGTRWTAEKCEGGRTRCWRDIFQVSRYDVKASGVRARVSARQAENTVFRVQMHNDVARAVRPSLKYAEVVYAEERRSVEALGEPEGRVQRDPRLRRTCGGRPCDCLFVDNVISCTISSESSQTA